MAAEDYFEASTDFNSENFPDRILGLHPLDWDCTLQGKYLDFSTKSTVEPHDFQVHHSPAATQLLAMEMKMVVLTKTV